MFRRLSLVALSLLAVAAGPKDDPRLTQTGQLTFPFGTWQRLRTVASGTGIPDWQLEIKKTGPRKVCIVSKINGKVCERVENVKLDPVRCTMDWGFKAIYHCEGEFLLICVGGEKRPDSFTPKGSDQWLWELRRTKR